MSEYQNGKFRLCFCVQPEVEKGSQVMFVDVTSIVEEGAFVRCMDNNEDVLLVPVSNVAAIFYKKEK